MHETLIPSGTKRNRATAFGGGMTKDELLERRVRPCLDTREEKRGETITLAGHRDLGSAFSFNPHSLASGKMPVKPEEKGIMPEEKLAAINIVINRGEESRYYLMEEAKEKEEKSIPIGIILEGFAFDYERKQILVDRFRKRIKKNKTHTYKFYSRQNFVNYLMIKENSIIGMETMKLDVLNVGQGSSNLLRYSRNKAAMRKQAIFNDLGVDIRNIADFIRSSSLSRIGTEPSSTPIYTILSHGHADHTACYDSASSQEVAIGLTGLINGRLAKKKETAETTELPKAEGEGVKPEPAEDSPSEKPTSDRDYTFVVLATGAHELAGIEEYLKNTFPGITITRGSEKSEEDEEEKKEEEEEEETKERVEKEEEKEEEKEKEWEDDGETEDEEEAEEQEKSPVKGLFDYLTIHLPVSVADEKPPSISKKYNEDSSIMVVDFGKTTYVLPGDAPLEEVRAAVGVAKAKGNKVVLVSSHHGSKTGNDKALLEQADIVIVSAGWDNVHGLPSTEGLFSPDERFHRGRKQLLTGSAVLGKTGDAFYNTAGFNRIPGSIVVKSGKAGAGNLDTIYTKQHEGRIFSKTFSGSGVKKGVIQAVEGIITALDPDEPKMKLRRAAKVPTEEEAKREDDLNRLKLCFFALCRKLDKGTEGVLYSRLKGDLSKDYGVAYRTLMNDCEKEGTDAEKALTLFPTNRLAIKLSIDSAKDAYDELMEIYLEAEALIREMETSVKSFKPLEGKTGGETMEEAKAGGKEEETESDGKEEEALKKRMEELKAEILADRNQKITAYLLEAMKDGDPGPKSEKPSETGGKGMAGAEADEPEKKASGRIKMDGNCMYNAVIQAGGLAHNAQGLRELCHQWLSDNSLSEEVSAFLVRTGTNVGLLFRVIGTMGRWADNEGDLVPYIIASAINRCITIVRIGGNVEVQPLIDDPALGAPAPGITVYHLGNHYEAERR